MSASPAKPAPAFTIATYQCSACGAVHNTGSGLPVGWSAIPGQGLTWCSDCAATDIGRRQIRQGKRA